MLRKIRIILAIIVFALITLLFLDFSGVLHGWFGWLARIQFIPALLALNVGVVIVLLALTLLFGRVYCSVICPLGVFQDVISNVSGRFKRNRFKYFQANKLLRYGFLALYVFALVAGISVIVSLLEPYSSYGRIASSFFNPLYKWGNNILAYFAERADSYAFYSVDVWFKGATSLLVASITLVIIGVLSWQSGRKYCNTVCPVGTVLGFLSRYSLCKPTIDTDKCNKCGLCERNCKAECINSKEYKIDYSRCVTCMNCIDKCKRNAIEYGRKKKIEKSEIQNAEMRMDNGGKGRREFLALASAFTLSQTLKAQQLHVDGGLAAIEDKKRPERKSSIVPPGADSQRHLKSHCTACQLCISICPNNILVPSSKLPTFMQPELSFEKGYCRPECTECSQVCPSKAIKPITTAEKSALSIGQAIWIKDNCRVNTDGIKCTSCERHCPTGAITRVALDSENPSLLFPVVDKELCIGCGACEHYCPARPFSAIYVEGNLRHHKV